MEASLAQNYEDGDGDGDGNGDSNGVRLHWTPEIEPPPISKLLFF